MFKPVSSHVNFPEVDASILQYWKDKNVFRRTETEREDGPLFTLFEGPPTANGSPGIHHVLARVFKDVICRYRTMKGYRVLRKGGWDTHGLPVELEVEKSLGLSTKQEVEEYGIEKFNQRCRESVFHYLKEWEVLTDRIGYWVDMDDPYITLENEYIESGWWILKELWNKGLLYQDMRGTPHCPRCVTSLSSHEVAMGYREDTPDPSVFVKFLAETIPDVDSVSSALTSDIPTYLLAWTTTPWTLPGNTALAVDESADYSIVELERDGATEWLVLASELLDVNLRDPYSVAGTVKGADLVGVGYRSLYSPAEFGVEIQRFVHRQTPGGIITELAPDTQVSPRVVAADFVSMDDGTGIVHIAPAFGDEDLSLGREKGLAFVQPVDLQGNVTGSFPWEKKFVKAADEEIMADLDERGLLFHRDIYRHTYPFCWRCNTPLLYYAKNSWYIRTTARKDRLVEGNSTINWYPDYIKEGRFGEWLRNNVDWAISRERYWGTPIPIWQCDNCGRTECIGSVDELAERSVQNVSNLDLHRPYVDSVTWPCNNRSNSSPRHMGIDPTHPSPPVYDGCSPANAGIVPDTCTGSMYRIKEVVDAWFDSGAMPFAQWHYPFENQDITRDGRFPADYICEAVDQTRGWFYSLHALSTLLQGEPSYRNVICLGLILDERGRKMSKSTGNVVEPIPVLDQHGADALRWYLFTASHPGEARRFSAKLVNETLRRVLLTLWNVYSFFTNYASIDGFHPDQTPDGWKPEHELDRWIMSELNALVTQVDGYLDGYDPTNAGRRMQEFIDQLSNWYVRRSRRRFWKSENDQDKLSGYITLRTCLVTLSKLMAPLSPFVAEEIYQNLVCSVDADAPDSVHLAAFPIADQSLVEEPLMEAMRLAMRISSMGRNARSKAGLKVRQPLAKVQIKPRSIEERKYFGWIRPQILEELNVKEDFIDELSSSLYEMALEKLGDKTEGVVQIEWGLGEGIERKWSVAVEGGYMVAVDSTITPELAEEGLARELVHRIQNLRRSSQFELTDRIVTYYDAPAEIGSVMQGNFSAYIRQETLSEDLVAGPPQEGAASEDSKVEGMEITLGVLRI